MSDIPAGWQPDPRGRHEYRYWDGTRWTDHVADQGKVSRDPVADTSPPGASGPAPETATTGAAPDTAATGAAQAPARGDEPAPADAAATPEPAAGVEGRYT